MALQVELLEQSFKAVAPRGQAFVASFYETLFAAHPEVTPLFGHVDMTAQRTKLLGALVLAVENLRRPEVLFPALRELGKRHVGYGVAAAHYPAVGGALLETFETFLGAEWTPEVKAAWTDAYGAIVSVMLEGANGGA